MHPRVSVVIRSFNRVSSLCELLERVLAQDLEHFEVVVVEQSTAVSAADAARLAELGSDPRVRILRHPPLGGARARNVGVGAARGDVVVFIDDDDVPVGTGWLRAHLANYTDPNCLGVSGRQVYAPDERDPYGRRRGVAFRRCQSFSPVLKLPWAYVRQTRPKRPVEQVHGTNGSIRRRAYERFGGWDVDTRIEDEASFGYRVMQRKRAEEYFCFDPAAVVLRRTDIPGGLDKRYMTTVAYYRRLMTFVHHIVARYHRGRVIALWPLYVWAIYGWTVDWIWSDSKRHPTVAARLLGTIGLAPLVPLIAVVALLAQDPRGEPAGGQIAPRLRELGSEPPD